MLANLEPTPREVTCVLHPDKLPYPLSRLSAATRLVAGSTAAAGPDSRAPLDLDARRLAGVGLKLTLPSDDAVLVRVR